MAELASKSPAELTKLFEEISGSGELKAEYERLEAEKKQAEEDQVFNHQKKKGLTQEKNNMKKQKEEGNWWNKATTIYYEEKNNPMNPKTWSNALNNCIIRKCDGIDHRRSTEVMADTSTEKGIGALGEAIVDPYGVGRVGRMAYNYATS